MAEQMEDIKRRIKSINSTERITNAMKLVSASKLRRAKSVFESSERYMNRLLTAISDTFDNAGDVPQDFLTGSREIKTACLVMITSSNGLCGSYNANVIRKAEELLAESHFQNVKLATIGTKGKEHFINRGYEIVMDHGQLHLRQVTERQLRLSELDTTMIHSTWRLHHHQIDHQLP